VINGVERRTDNQQHDERHFAVVDGVDKVVVDRLQSCFGRVEASVG